MASSDGKLFEIHIRRLGVKLSSSRSSRRSCSNFPATTIMNIVLILRGSSSFRESNTLNTKYLFVENFTAYLLGSSSLDLI